jgi:hypothetical protein
MFQLGYLCVIAFAAVPVARTFLQAPRDNQIAFVHRGLAIFTAIHLASSLEGNFAARNRHTRAWSRQWLQWPRVKRAVFQRPNQVRVRRL